MIFGAITNSWRQQLDGQDLVALVTEAQARGARHIELRQTCLGHCESGEGEHWRPVLPRLEALVQACPGLSFDLAMAWPCLTQPADPAGEQFQAALQGAKLVGGTTPHLRLVDPTAFDHPWEKPEGECDSYGRPVQIELQAQSRGGPAGRPAPRTVADGSCAGTPSPGTARTASGRPYAGAPAPPRRFGRCRRERRPDRGHGDLAGVDAVLATMSCLV